MITTEDTENTKKGNPENRVFSAFSVLSVVKPFLEIA